MDTCSISIKYTAICLSATLMPKSVTLLDIAHILFSHFLSYPIHLHSSYSINTISSCVSYNQPSHYSSKLYHREKIPINSIILFHLLFTLIQKSVTLLDTAHILFSYFLTFFYTLSTV